MKSIYLGYETTSSDFDMTGQLFVRLKLSTTILLFSIDFSLPLKNRKIEQILNEK